MKSLANLDRLRLQEGLYGRLGYYEAIDYTPERLPAEAKGASSSSPTWRITRGWACSRSTTC